MYIVHTVTAENVSLLHLLYTIEMPPHAVLGYIYIYISNIYFLYMGVDYTVHQTRPCLGVRVLDTGFPCSCLEGRKPADLPLR